LGQAAIAGAVSHAAGVRMQKLPVNPGANLEVQWAKHR
jgi:CO/xanthine dehydrogenase Mo-binding subunit